MDSERKDIIDKLAKVSDSIRDKKELILKLAKNIEKNLDKPDIKNMCVIIGIDNPDKSNISSIIKRLRDKHFKSISNTWIQDVLPREYKRVYDKEMTEKSEVVRLSDSYISEHAEELKAKIKQVEQNNTPAKPIIPKARVDEMQKHSWKCWFAEELALLAIKLETEHEEKHEDKMCKEYSKRARTTRDSRFATSMNAYEAIILAINTSQSLKNAISGEWEFKTVWEVREDEKKCRECLGFKDCEKNNCKHECHRVVRPMTTKGLKWAIKTNDELNELDKEIKRLTEINNDLCRMGKMILENPKSKKLLGRKEQTKLIYAHIEREDCLQCDLFLEKNPNFLKSDI
jgi:hypothetical protein